MPTMTGRPEATCARTHDGSGSRTIIVECPGTCSAELKIAPEPLNHPECAAIEAGVTERYPKCEYTMARSVSRHPICHTWYEPPPTAEDAHRASRWLKYPPQASPAGWFSTKVRSVLPPPLPAPARPRAMSHAGHVSDETRAGALPNACTTPWRSSTHPPGDRAGAAVHATSESAMSWPGHPNGAATAGAPPNGWTPPE